MNKTLYAWCILSAYSAIGIAYSAIGIAYLEYVSFYCLNENIYIRVNS